MIRLLLTFFLLVIVADSFATEYPVRIPGISGKQYAFTYAPQPSANFVPPSFTANVPVRVPITIDQSPLINVPATISPNLIRVGAAIAGFARITGPIGAGIQIASLICSTTSFCQSPTDPSQFYKQDTSTMFPPDGDDAELCSRYVNGWVVESVPVPVSDGAPYFACKFNYADGTTGIVGRWPITGTDIVPVKYLPLTDSDWLTVAQRLASLSNKLAEMVNDLIQQGQPVPVDNPVLSPSQVTTPSVSTIVRDANGNPISTVTNTTTIYSNPTNTYINEQPVTNITYNIVSTTTDNTTNTTTTTTTTNPNPSSPPPDPTIEFDAVQDATLPSQELPLSLNTSSWGEGTCPADPSTMVLGHQIVVPVHVVCNYMSGVRMAVLAFFALVAAYIIIGVKHEG